MFLVLDPEVPGDQGDEERLLYSQSGHRGLIQERWQLRAVPVGSSQMVSSDHASHSDRGGSGMTGQAEGRAQVTAIQG